MIASVPVKRPLRIPDAAQLRFNLQRVLEELVEVEALPGATGAVAVTRGEIVTASAGLSDIENNVAMKISDRMLAGSIGKTFVAAAALRLVDAGRFDLDTPIRNWLENEPWCERLPLADQITMRMLLNHSSGYLDHVHDQRYTDAIKNPADNFRLTHEFQISLLFDTPTLFAPGTDASYSDTNYIIAGVIIERVSGKDYYDLIQEYFLSPLGLDRTSPQSGPRLMGLVPGYTAPEDMFSAFGLPRRLMQDGALVYDPAREWTGGGLISNAVDLSIWARALYGGEVLPGGLLTEMLTSMAPYLPGKSYPPSRRYGLGVSLLMETPLGPIWGHRGSIPGYGSLMMYARDYCLSIAIQANTTTFDMTQEAIEVIFQRVMDGGSKLGRAHPRA